MTDFLLGQADPIGRADAIRHLQSDPGSLDLARRIQTGLAVIAPDADQPSLPEPRTKRRRAALPDTSDGPAAPAAPADPEAAAAARRRNALVAGLAAVGVIIVFAVLAVAGVFSSDDGSTDTTDTTTTTANENLARVELKPVSSSGVAGSVDFGAVAGDQVYVDVNISGLDPSPPKGTTYLLWLMIGGTGGFPLQTPLTPDQNGGFSGRLAVPTAIAYTVGRQADSVKVSATQIADIKAVAAKAVKQQVPIVPFTGDELATGDIPLVKGGGSQGGASQGGGNQGGSGG